MRTTQRHSWPRTQWIGRVSLAVLLMGAFAIAAEPLPKDVKTAEPTEKPEHTAWYHRLTGSKAPEKTFGNSVPRIPVTIAPLEPAALAAALKAEQQAWDRRLEVCHKLRVLAAETNNDKLAAEADDLERQATALYHQRSARLGVKAPLRPSADRADASPATTAKTPERTFKVVNP
ncbi:MAG: hypothetical protein ACRC8S_16425 [Fimbriiglobus sp.]